MSKTRLFRFITALDVLAVTALLEKSPDLIHAIGDRRRNPLHFLCGLPAGPKTSGRALTLARRLLEAGLDVNAPAFVEGAFRATPLWAAAFAENVAAIDLLVRSGARLDPVAEDETPFLGAIKWRRNGRSPLDLVRNRRDRTYFELVTRRPATPR